jgi:hypothetical protein
MTTTKWFNNRIDYNTSYSSIEELFSQFGPPYGAGDNKIIPNGFFWSSLAINVLLRSREYSANPTQNQCSNKENEITVYSYIHNETTMMMLGLIVLSWLKVNLKKKQRMDTVIILLINQQQQQSQQLPFLSLS